jgi:hypothetical protein
VSSTYAEAEYKTARGHALASASCFTVSLCFKILDTLPERKPLATLYFHKILFCQIIHFWFGAQDSVQRKNSQEKHPSKV